LLQAVGTQIRHGGQKIIRVNSNHADFKKVQVALSHLTAFFKTLKSNAEQLSQPERMRRVIYRAFKKFIENLKTDPPNLILSRVILGWQGDRQLRFLG
jgi:hypothetical protein